MVTSIILDAAQIFLFTIEPSNYYGFCFKWVKIGLGAVHEMRWLT